MPQIERGQASSDSQRKDEQLDALVSISISSSVTSARTLMPLSFLFLLFVPLIVLAAAPQPAACLSYDEQKSLAALNARTLKQFGADELENRGPKMVQLITQMRELRDQIGDCQRASEGTLGGALGLQSCSTLIREHNQLAQDLDALMTNMKAQQELINTMLQLNRSQFRNCD
jgi:hypothetical protein